MSDTIGDMKRQYRAVSGIPEASQCLVFRGTQLDDDSNTLASYDMINGSHIMSIVKIRKPVIYIMPTKPLDVSVRLTLTPYWSFSVLYPAVRAREVSKSGSESVEWRCSATVDGILTDPVSGRSVSYLYWEAL